MPVTLRHPPLLLTYRTQRSDVVMTGLDPVIFIGWLLTRIVSFAIWCGCVMAGLILGSSPRTAMTEIESRFQRLALAGDVPHATDQRRHGRP